MSRMFLIVFSVFLVGPLRAQTPVPIGAEFPVNTTASSDQQIPIAVMSVTGDFTVVWQSLDQDGSGWGVYGQRFSGVTGAPLGGELGLTSTTAGDQLAPAAAADAAGKSAVAWQGPDGSSWGIYAAVRSSTGSVLVSEIAVNSVTSGAQTAPAIALAESGRFLVAWQGPGDGSGNGIFGRLFDVSGMPLTGEIAVNTTTTGEQTRPAVGVVPADGSFVVVWEGDDAAGRGVFSRCLDADGSALGSEHPVNTMISADQETPVIAFDHDGDFIVVWASFDGDERGIFARFFDATATGVGADFQVNDTIAGDQTDPDVAIDADGDALVVWASADAPSLEGSTIPVRAKRLSQPGTHAERGTGSGEFLISTATLGKPTVAAEDNGDFAVAWEGLDRDGVGIFARRYTVAPPIFANGFESGNTSAWSGSVP